MDATTVDSVEIIFATNCNCLSGTGDATIALNARTLYIASESDTSLQSARAVGKSAAVSLARAGGANFGVEAIEKLRERLQSASSPASIATIPRAVG